MIEVLLTNGALEIDETTGHYNVYDLNGDFVSEGVKNKYMSLNELLDFLGLKEA